MSQTVGPDQDRARYIAIGRRLGEARVAAGFTHDEMADVLGVKQPTYTRYENGLHRISIPDLEKLARFLGVSTAFLLGDVDRELAAIDNLLFHNIGALTPQQKENLLPIVRSLKESNEGK